MPEIEEARKSTMAIADDARVFSPPHPAVPRMNTHEKREVTSPCRKGKKTRKNTAVIHREW